MKKIRSKLSLVLLLILSFVVMLGAAASMLVNADAKTNDGPAVVEVYSDDWYEITITNDSLTILLDAQIGSYRSVSRDDLVNIKNAAVKAIRTLVIEQILNGASTQSYSESVALNAVMPIDVSDDVYMKDMYGRYITYLTERFSITADIDGETHAVEIEKFIAGKYDALIEYVASRYANDSDHDSAAELKDLIEKAHRAVMDVIDSVLGELAKNGDVLVNGVTITDATKQGIRDDVNAQLKEISQKVFDNDGQMSSMSIDRLLDMIYGVKIGDYQVYNGEKFVLSEIKRFISSLPKASEIANWTDEEMNLSYNIAVNTTLGNVGFNLTVGLKGDSSSIRKAAQFIADHVTAYNNNGVYTVEVITPDEFAALMLKLSNTSRIPDDIKHKVFGLFNKTGDEIFDKASGYSYQQILDYLKGKDFQSLFAGLLDAQKIKDYFGGFGVDLSKLTDENLDKAINKILDYAERVANKKTVEGVEDFLASLGVPVGIPSQLEGAVQKFLNLLNKIDYKYWNATTIREFLNDNGRFNAKVDALLTRLANSAKAEKIYNALIEVAETIFDYLPDQIHNGTILDIYRGNGEISWAGNINYDVKSVITKIAEKLIPYAEAAGFENAEEYIQYIEGFIDSYFEGEMTLNVDLSLKLSLTDIYKVEYVVNDEIIGAGLLPVDADVVFYANKTEVDGLEIIAWVDEEGTRYEKMPAKDVTLYAVTEIEAYISVDGEEVQETIEKVYDGEPIVLTVEIKGAAGANPIFTWYKDGELFSEVAGMDGATIELVNVADSGVYYCVVTNGDFDFITAETQKVTVIITKAPIDPSVTIEGWTYGEEANEPVVEGNLGNGEVTYVYEGIDGTEYGPSDKVPENAGKYKVTAKIAETDNYLGGEAECEFTITKATIDPSVTIEGWTYGEQANEPVVEGNLGNGEVTYVYEGIDGTEYGPSDKVPENAGKYKLTAKIAETENYLGGEAECTFTISKAELELEVSVADWTYGEEASEVVLKGNLGNGTVTYLYEGTNGTVYSSSEKPENAGTYKLTVKVAETENYLGGEAECEFTIHKAELKLELSIADWTYGEKASEVVFEGNLGNGTVTYLYEGTNDTVYSNSEKPVNAGTYKLTVTVAETENYLGGEAECTFTIHKAKLTVTVDPEQATYNNAAHNPTVTVTGVNEEVLAANVDYTITYYLNNVQVTELKNAGVYTVKITLNNTEKANNYEAPEEDCTYTITKAELDFSGYWVPDPADYTYDGNEHTVEFVFHNEFDIPADVEFEVVNNKGTNAGKYYAYIVLTYNADNYEITLPEKGSSEDNAYVWEIKQAVLSIKDVEFVALSDGFDSEWKVVFNGEEHGVTYKVKEGKAYPEGTVFTCEGTWSATNVGEYTAKLIISTTNPNYKIAENEDSISLKWSITPKVITVTVSALWDYSKEFIFDGTLHTVKLLNEEEVFEAISAELLKGYKPGYKNNANTEVDTYVAEVTVLDSEGNPTDNYQIVGIASLEWKIVGEIELDLSGYHWSASKFTYNGELWSVTLVNDEGEDVLDKDWGLFEEYSLRYFNNAATNAGTYKAFIAVVRNDEISSSYVIIGLEYGTEEAPYEWTIEKQEVTFEAPAFTVTHEGETVTEQVYDGKEYVVKIAHAIDEEIFDVVISGDALSQTNAGTYTVIVTVSLKDADNYSYTGETVFKFEWTIAKQEVTFEEPTFTVTHEDKVVEEQVYDGKEYVVKIAHAIDEEIFDVVVSGNALSQTNAGTYTVTVTVSLKDAENYEYKGKAEFTFTWTIEKAKVELVKAPELNQTSFVYDTTEHTVEVIYISNPEEAFDLEVNEGTLSATNANTYTVIVAISLKDADNYSYDGETEFTLTWEITKAEVELVTAPKLKQASFEYDTTEHTVEIEYETNPANVFNCKTSGTLSAINADTYTVNVVLELIDAENYIYDGQTEFELEWTITKQEVTFEAPTFTVTHEDKVVSEQVYDGKEYVVKIAHAIDEEIFNVVIGGNALSQTKAGAYTVTVTVSLKDADNYSYAGETVFEFEWTIEKATIEKVIAVLEVKQDDETVANPVYNKMPYTVSVNFNCDADKLAELFNINIKYIDNATQTNAGTYRVTVVLELIDAENYSYDGKTEFELEWTIAKQEVTFEAPAFTVTHEGRVVAEQVYDGKEYVVEISHSIDEEIFNVKISGNALSQTKAGTYNVTVTVSLKDADNYNYDGQTEFEFEWTIEKATIEEVKPILEVKQDGKVVENPVYNKMPYTANVSFVDADKLAELFNIEIKYLDDDTQINAGKYHITVALELKDSENYRYNGSLVIVLEWEITPAPLFDITGHWVPVGFDWNDGYSVIFNGSAYYVEFKLDRELPENILAYYEGTRSATDVGTYTVEFKLLSKDGNYGVQDFNGTKFTWKIVAKEIDLSNAEWDTTALTFNGQSQSVMLKNAQDLGLVDGYKLEYYGNTATNAGTYYAHVAIVTTEGKTTLNYVVTGLAEGGSAANPHMWTIAKKVITVEYAWSANTEFTYDGNPHTVTLTYTGADSDKIKAEYANNSYTDAGNYVATAVLTLGEEYADNYTFESVVIDKEWSIAKKVIELSTSWSAITEFTYDGTLHTVTLTYTGNDSDKIKAEYANNSYINAGEYIATAILTLNEEYANNYAFENVVLTKEWSIAKKVITVNASWSNATKFTYDGNEHSVTLTYSGNDSDKVKVTYANNSHVDAGEYVATAVLTLNAEYVDNYTFGSIELTQKWSIAKQVITINAKDVIWSATEFTYTGARYTVTLTYKGEHSDKVNVTYANNSHIEAGEYVATAMFELAEEFANNYALENAKLTKEWSIAKQVIKVNASDFVWGSTAFTYDGNTHTVTLRYNGANSDMIKVTYANNSHIDAGDYVATAIITLSANYADNYTIENLELTQEWSIAKKVLSVRATWSGLSQVEFDGNPHTVTLKVLGVDKDKVDVTYLSSNVETDAGKYLTVAKLTLNSEYNENNYMFNVVGEYSYEWTITAKAVYLTGYRWNGVSFEYNEDGVEVKLVDKSGNEPTPEALKLAPGYELQYRGNVATKVGSYVAEIVIVDLNGETGNYVLKGNTYTAWSIVKKEITVDTSWSSDIEFKYDGTRHGVTFSVTGEYADYVTFNVKNNSFTEAGNYVAVAELKLKAGYSSNYTLSKSVYTLSWKIVGIPAQPTEPQPPVQENTTLVAEGGELPEGVKVTVTASQPLPDNCKLAVSLTPNEYKDEDFRPFVADGMRPSIVRVYGISIENLPDNFGGEFTVTISNSEFAGKDLIVVHVPLDAEGKPVDRELWSNTDASLAGKNLTFGTPGFSDFAVVEQIRESNSLWLMWLLLVIIIILLVIVILLLIKLLRKDDEPEEEDDEIQHPVVIIKTIEEVLEEETAEEPEADEDIDAKSAALLVEDAAEESTESAEVEPLVAKDGSRIIYDRSFTARLIQSDITLKDYYTELKNYIMSYNGVKSRISWHFDSFNMGREKCVKIQFRGKSMYIYLPLTTEEVPEKYNVKDVSEMSRYAGVPTMFKVRKPRSVKYAKELIDMVMQKLGGEQGEIPNVKYRPRYRSTNSLIDMGLIKVKTTNSTFIAPKTNND